jgi:TMEM175 potassium channel family protein
MSDRVAREAPVPWVDAEEATGIGFDRLVFFSDAVFAIAMTLLVIDVRLPELAGRVGDADLAAALSELWPRIFAYALSFTVIGLYWLAHWRRYMLVRRADDRLALLNLVLLGLVAFIPFPTSILGEYGVLPVAVAFYAIVLGLAGLAGTAGWLYAASHHQLRPTVTSIDIRAGVVRGLVVPVVFFGSLLALPLVGPAGTELLWLLAFPALWVVESSIRRADRSRRATDDQATI